MKKIVIGLFLLVFLTGCSLTNRIMVSGDSMEPTLKAGEIRTYRKNGPIQRYDIIVVNYQGEKLIKRVYALPGETIKCTNGKLFINDNLIDDIYGQGTIIDFEEVTLKETEYFVIGDNHEVSVDSTTIGPININAIIGVIN